MIPRGMEMKPPCMIVVQYVLPTIRMLILKDLIEKQNLRKIDASKRMELTPAAITQYMKGERGKAFAEKISKSGKAMKIVSDLAEALANDDIPAENTIDKLCEACSTIRAEGIICEIHKERLPGLRKSVCTICERAP
jgi:predicted transcriptional regulator